jgi:YbgC/YbaW family acyl-CoA thioester hydrolase
MLKQTPKIVPLNWTFQAIGSKMTKLFLRLFCMVEGIHRFPILIRETHLDILGHVNNAAYLRIAEEARWQWLAESGYGVEKMMQTGMGPVILELTIAYKAELRLREDIDVQTRLLSWQKKVGVLEQAFVRKDQSVAALITMRFGLFDLKARKLVVPTGDWLQALGITGLQPPLLDPLSSVDPDAPK